MLRESVEKFHLQSKLKTVSLEKPTYDYATPKYTSKAIEDKENHNLDNLSSGGLNSERVTYD